MAVQVRIELNSAGIRQFLSTDPGIKDDLQARADAVQQSADSKLSSGEGHEASVYVGRDRQRATIRTATFEARQAEAENHTLTSSLDAARSP